MANKWSKPGGLRQVSQWVKKEGVYDELVEEDQGEVAGYEKGQEFCQCA